MITTMRSDGDVSLATHEEGGILLACDFDGFLVGGSFDDGLFIGYFAILGRLNETYTY